MTSVDAPGQRDEAAVLARARAGDHDAFNSLVRLNEGPVYSLAFRLLGNSEDALDATQDAFFNAYRAIAGFRGEQVRPWLFRIAVRCCYDQLRKRGRRREQSLDDTTKEDWDPPASPGEGPEQSTLRQETARAIEASLDELPFDQRAIVVLCDVQGLSYEEAAEVADIELGTVKSRLSRARARMRQLLKVRGELPGGADRPTERE